MLDPNAEAALKEVAWNDRGNAVSWRSLMAEMANACLAEHGYAGRIGRQNHAERDISLELQNKIGLNIARRCCSQSYPASAP